MTAGVRSLSLEETLLEPPALPPPPTRHALFAILIASAALLHVATIGTGDLSSQTEGQYAGAAREMVEAHHWLLPTNDGVPRLQKPPLLYWLIIVSFKLFGVSAAAARLPCALAVVASVALIFFSVAAVHFCSPALSCLNRLSARLSRAPSSAGCAVISVGVIGGCGSLASGFARPSLA